MLIRKDSLIIAVDGARMSVFRNKGEAFAPELELAEEHHATSQKTSELGTDRPGRTFTSKSPRRGAHELTDLQQLEEDRFAIDAAERIEELVSRQGADLVLVAAPRALGVLRKHLGPRSSKQLLAEIPKTFCPEDSAPLAKMLANHEV